MYSSNKTKTVIHKKIIHKIKSYGIGLNVNSDRRKRQNKTQTTATPTTIEIHNNYKRIILILNEVEEGKKMVDHLIEATCLLFILIFLFESCCLHAEVAF